MKNEEFRKRKSLGMDEPGSVVFAKLSLDFLWVTVMCLSVLYLSHKLLLLFLLLACLVIMYLEPCHDHFDPLDDISR